MTTSDQYAQGKVPFTNYVIAVVDTPGAAQKAREALEAEGFAAADIAMSAPLQPSTPESERQQGTLADPPTHAESLFTEEGLDQEQYAAERRQGHVVIQVQTSQNGGCRTRPRGSRGSPGAYDQTGRHVDTRESARRGVKGDREKLG